MFAGGHRAPPPGPAGAALRNRAIVLTTVALLLIAAAAWTEVLWSALAPPAMDHMTMTASPSLAEGIMYVAGWTVMMTAMMLPSALPMIALYAATQRDSPSLLAKTSAVTLFTLVYLGLWALTGVPMYIGSVVIEGALDTLVPYGVALALVSAGIFQLTPFKQLCLRHCRTPLGFLLGRWRPGWRGGLALGWAHAMYCLGCCWALMVVLVAAGAMGLPWVLLITAIVAAEKLLPGGEWVARVMGVGLVLLGLTVALRPDLALVLRASGHTM